MEKVTKEFMELMGFKCEKALGGFMNYYYEPLYFQDGFHFSPYYHIGLGRLSIPADRLPESKEVLIKMLREIHTKYGEFTGKRSIQNELQQLLGLED